MKKPPPFLLAIVEDEPSLRENLIDFFTIKGMRAVGFGSAEALYAALDEHSFDLLILDVLLPGDSGIEAAKFVRTRVDVPILVLTAHNNNQAHLSSLESGADMFLSKSAPLEILEHSVRNMLLRAQKLISANAQVNDFWALSLQYKYLIAPNQLRCPCTNMEFLLLYALFNRVQQTVFREDLLQAMDKMVTISNLRNLDTYISRIRRKCLNVTQLDIPIQAAYNLGYTFTSKVKFLP